MTTDERDTALAIAAVILDGEVDDISEEDRTLARAVVDLADEVKTRRSLMVRGYADATNIAVRHAEQRTAEQIAQYLEDQGDFVGAKRIRSGAWRKP